MARATVSAGTIAGFLSYAERNGADRAALLAQVGLTGNDLEPAHARLPFAAHLRVIRAAVAATGNSALALEYGAATDLSEVSLVGLITLSAPTMADALRELNRYGRLVVDAGQPRGERFVLSEESDGLWVIDQRLGALDSPELSEITFARMICGPRRFAPELRCSAVELVHPAPRHAARVRELFGAPVQFAAGRNAFRIDHGWLGRRVATQPVYLAELLGQHADRLMEALGNRGRLQGQVEQAIAARLHTGGVSVAAIAAQLGQSRQTLHRRLRAEGTSFEAVLEALRRRLANDYLATGRFSVSEVAYLLGYSDPSAFSRAFKRWTGHSPGRSPGQ